VKRLMVSILAIMLISSAAIALESGGQDSSSTFRTMDETESILFGQSMTGGLIERLTKVEIALFGRELPGSIAARQTALVNFIEKGNNDQPSMLFKLGVAEWALTQQLNAYDPVNKRVAFLESSLEGQTMENKPLAMRLERLLSLLIGDNIAWQDVEIPSDFVMKVSLLGSLSPKTSKAGDQVSMSLNADLVMGNCLVAPKGSKVTGHISKVKKPQSFGRASEISISFDALQPLGPEGIPIVTGEASEKARKVESAQVAAVGTSFVGAVLLGPVGLAGGFLVRGDAKEVPEGTVFFVQTPKVVRVSGYPVPPGLQGMISVPSPVSSEDSGDDLVEVSTGQ